MSRMMLTTIDNPYNPFKQFDQWWQWDHLHRYFCCEYLARVAPFSDDLSEADQEEALEDGMREIVAMNPTGMYTLVFADESEQSS